MVYYINIVADTSRNKSVRFREALNVRQFDAHRKGDAALAKVQADIDLGIALGIDGTPSVFINGRRVYDTRGQALQFLIMHEMEHSGHTHDHR